MEDAWLPPNSVHEIILALNNLQVAYFELYCWDWTPIVLMRVAINLDFFSLCKPESTRIHVFEDFINQVCCILTKFRKLPSTFY